MSEVPVFSFGAESKSTLLRQLASQLATSLSVVTTIGDRGKPCGMTISAVTSLSVSPAQFLICVNHNSETLSAALQSRKLCINFLASTQEHISRIFSTRSVNKFEGIPHRRHSSSLPILDGTLAYAICEVTEVFPGGDHKIVVGGLLDGEVRTGDPLLYFRREYREFNRLPMRDLQTSQGLAGAVRA